MKTPDGAEQEVVIFSNDTFTLGQCTPFRSILINERALNDERLLNYAFIHEMAHKKQWYLILLLYPMLSVGLVIFIFSATGVCISLILWLGSMDPAVFQNFVAYLSISLLALAIPCGFSWALEIGADFSAIKHTGLQTFLEIKAQSGIKPGLGKRIIFRLTHPPSRVTVCLWHRFHKQKSV
jgi:hypothetical protein